MSAFEQIVTDSLGRIEGKVDDLARAHGELKEHVALSDQRHGLLGVMGGALSGIATALAAYFLAPHK